MIASLLLTTAMAAQAPADTTSTVACSSARASAGGSSFPALPTPLGSSVDAAAGVTAPPGTTSVRSVRRSAGRSTRTTTGQTGDRSARPSGASIEILFATTGV